MHVAPSLRREVTWYPWRGCVISESFYKHHCSQCPGHALSLPVWVHCVRQSLCTTDSVILPSREATATHTSAHFLTALPALCIMRLFALTVWSLEAWLQRALIRAHGLPGMLKWGWQDSHLPPLCFSSHPPLRGPGHSWSRFRSLMLLLPHNWTAAGVSGCCVSHRQPRHCSCNAATWFCTQL